MAKSSVEAMTKAGIGVRLASPDQPYVPKTRPYVHAKDIAQQMYGQFADWLMEHEEKKKRPRFLQKREKPRVSLEEILSDIDSQVEEAYRKEVQEISGSLPDAVPEESVAGFKEVARKEFLTNVAKYWPELRAQVYTLAPELAPPPEVSKETLKTLRELQAQVDKAVEQAEKALREILQALDVVAAAAKEEAALLRGTAEENKGRFKDLPSELVWQLKNRLTAWVGRQAGMVEREKPLTGNRRKW